MNKIILASLLVFFSTTGEAQCLKSAQTAVSAQKLNVKVDSQAYRSFYHALKHYREISGDFGSEQRPFIQKIQTMLKSGKISGYNVFITDGGDESTIRYLFNANKKLVVAYWYNQSPYTFWFCGKNTPVSEEETLDGSEVL